MIVRDVEAFDQETDVVVMGTGAGGLLAALTAHRAGKRVVLLEKMSSVGGTTAVSGGVIWIPNNPQMNAAGLTDDRDVVIDYILRCADERAERAMVERYVDMGPEMVRYVEANTEVRFAPLMTYPDYQPNLEGGRDGGRSLDNGLFDTNTLGAFKDLLRKNPLNGRAPMTIAEAMDWGVFSKPFGFPYKEIAARAKNGIVHGGAALCGKLLRALLDVGIEPMMQTPAEALVVSASGEVIGVVAQKGETTIRIRAHKGVIMASGGFEWDESLRRTFLPAFADHPLSPPGNTGDALKMAMAVGAELGNMAEAWWTPAIEVPGETYDGAPLYRPEFSVRCLPRSIVVNAHGRRFTDESHNYNDMVKPFFTHDAARCEPRNKGAWLIVDHGFLEKYVFVTAMNGRPIPDYIVQADTLEALARACGIDEAGLVDEVARFNVFAREGLDRDFGRGASSYERFYGDPENAPAPNLGPLDKAPFYAVRIHSGTMGTKGGPRCTIDGQVRRVGGQPVPGLYACGNAMASAMGGGYPGAGVTIAASMIFGWLAAQHAAAR